MMKIIAMMFAMLFTNIASAAVIKPEIPIHISSVNTAVVNENLIRVIEYNVIQEPKIVIEMLTRPRKSVVQRLEIKSIKYGNRILDFYESAATSFESIKMGDKFIKIGIYYVYPGKGGGSVDLTCLIQVTDTLSTPVCSEK